MADLTKADKDALARLPHDWFSVTNVTYMVRRPWWRCERLFKLGVLERRDVGQVWQYRRATDGVAETAGETKAGEPPMNPEKAT